MALDVAGRIFAQSSLNGRASVVVAILGHQVVVQRVRHIHAIGAKVLISFIMVVLNT